MSNNVAENSIRPFVVGRKNWEFSTAVKGAEASAAVYSIVEMAKANRLDCRKYLTYLFEKFSSWISEAIPACLCDFVLGLMKYKKTANRTDRIYHRADAR
jgi:hypothetical protein